MSIVIHNDSHMDHGLTSEAIAFIALHFHGRKGVFKETVELPPEFGTLPCALFGPAMGDEPVRNAELRARRGRNYMSRTLQRDTRETRLLTVIGGPHDGYECVVYTAFGGPLAPKEPNDPTLRDDEREESTRFWGDHALAIGDNPIDVFDSLHTWQVWARAALNLELVTDCRARELLDQLLAARSGRAMTETETPC